MHPRRFYLGASKLLFLAVLGIVGVGGRMSAQAQTYRVTDLGTINTDPETGVVSSHPTGINGAGQVTGYSYSGTSNHAARFTNGFVEDLGVIPGGETSTGWGINALGDVVGDSQYSVNGGSIRHAALFRNGMVTDLGFLPGWGNYARGTGINDAGEVVGYSGASLSTSNTRAFIWDAANGMRDLGTLGGQYARAFSINNSSVVTGNSQIPSGFGSDHAFIWGAVNGMRDLGVIAGSSSSGNFINANGHVAGWSSISTDNRRHAFLHDGTTMHDLGAIGDNDFLTDRSEAYGVNIHDVVVGTTYRPYQGGAAYAIAFVYRDGQMLDLETLVDESGANYRLYTATGINDAGQIAVDAVRIGSPNEFRAVLLTPTGMPTPSPAPTPTATPATTPSPTPMATTTPQVTTPTPTPTATATSPVPTSTPSPSPVLTATPATTPTSTPTPTTTATPIATPIPTATPDTTPTPAPTTQAINLSTRLRVQNGDNVGVGGFIITGNSPKHVLLRAIGPSLTQSGVPDALADPVLELHGPGVFVTITNDNWRDDPAQEALILARGIAPTDDLESAIDTTLDPGTYTAAVSGKNNSSGIGLVEVYDLDQSGDSKLANLSTRAFVSTGDSVVIAGFILSGNSGSDRIAARGIGPSLVDSNVPNALTDPALELRNSDGAVLLANNDWQENSAQAAELIAAGLAPTNPLESGLVAMLPPGLYTAMLSGVDNGAGVGLVEVYELGTP